jgi:hypothetical protein
VIFLGLKESVLNRWKHRLSQLCKAPIIPHNRNGHRKGAGVLRLLLRVRSVQVMSNWRAQWFVLAWRKLVAVQASAVREPKDFAGAFLEITRTRPGALFVIT